MCKECRYPEETMTITFDMAGKEGPAGRADDGRIVLVDRYSHADVRIREAWDCRLLLSLDGRYYLAWPVSRSEGRPAVPADDSGVASAVGGDTLRCKRFDSDRYAAYRSLDGTRLELVPDDRGDIIRQGDSVRIPGMDRLLPRVLPCMLRTSQRGRGLVVMLGR